MSHQNNNHKPTMSTHTTTLPLQEINSQGDVTTLFFEVAVLTQEAEVFLVVAVITTSITIIKTTLIQFKISTVLLLNYHTSQHFSPKATVSCQICGRSNHIAIDCYNRMSSKFVGKIPLTKLVAFVAQQNSYFPTTCSTHFT